MTARPPRAGPLALLAALGLMGCGPSGPPRYELSGEVRYVGQPVKAGTIRFEPAEGPLGPHTIAEAEIRDGRYHLPPEAGVVGGPHVVYVTAFDGVAEPESRRGAPLFPNTYVEKVDLPRESSTRDFDIPRQRR